MEDFTREEERIDLIERYHRGLLSAGERTALQKRMAEDPEFAKEVKKYSFILGGMDHLRADDFKQQLQSWEAERQAVVTPIWSNRRSVIYLAAAVLLLLIITPFLFRQLNSSTSDAASYLAENLQDFAPDLNRRGESDIVPSDSAILLLRTGLDRYQDQDYEVAAAFLQRSLGNQAALSDQERYNGLLCLGVAHLRLEQYRQAMDQLEQIPDNSLYQEHASWYRAVAYVLSGDPEMARSLLRDLRSNTYYGARVNELLNRIPD